MLIVRGGVWLGLCRGVGVSMVWNVFLGWAYEWDGLYEVTRVGSGELLARGFAFSDGVLESRDGMDIPTRKGHGGDMLRGWPTNSFFFCFGVPKLLLCTDAEDFLVWGV